MIKVNLKIDTLKLGDDIANKIEANIEDSEILELLSRELRAEISNLINMSVQAVVHEFEHLNGVVS